jgi:uncharacterized membrane protein
MANPITRQATVPLWAQRASLVLSLTGLAISAYLTLEHFTTPTVLACPDTGIVSCQKVTSSAQSTLLGIPVALLGLLFFAAMTALTVPRAWADHREEIRKLRVAAAVTGVLFVVYLIWVELFVVDAICLWCTAVHAVAIALFSVIVLGVTAAPPPRTKSVGGRGVGTGGRNRAGQR